MKHVCPFCGHPISKSWLFLGSLVGPPYQCPHCHAWLKFTPLRYVVNFVVGALGAWFLIYTGRKTGLNWEWFVFILPLFIFVSALVIWFTPGQYRLERDGLASKKSDKAGQSQG